MPDIEIWKFFSILGVPGVALGVFYMLYRKFEWKMPTIPRKWVGPICVLFLSFIFILIMYTLTLWKPNNSNSGSVFQFSSGDNSPNFNRTIKDSRKDQSK